MKVYIGAKELAQQLGISKSKAYVIMQELNKELKEKGYIVIAGRVPRKYVEEKYYGYGIVN